MIMKPPQNILVVVSIILIVPVSIVQKEDDMKKVLLNSVRPDHGEAIKSAYFDKYKSTPKKEDDWFSGYMNDAFKRTKRYKCYVREAINENFECSLQCLKYMYKCGNFL